MTHASFLSSLTLTAWGGLHMMHLAPLSSFLAVHIHVSLMRVTNLGLWSALLLGSCVTHIVITIVIINSRSLNPPGRGRWPPTTEFGSA